MKLPKLPRLDELRWPTPERWRQLAPLGALLALTILSIWIYLPTFRGEVAGDDNTFHFAEAARLRECLGHHDFDFWNPSANNGFATGYYYQLVPAFVPAIGSWIFGGSILWWFQLGVFLPFVLVPAAAYRGMRMMKATPWEAVGAAGAVAVAAGASKWGFASDGTFTVGLYTQGWAFAAFPLALGHGARWIDEKKSLGSAAFWGLFVGLCHPVAGVALGIALFAAELGRYVRWGLRWIWEQAQGPLPPMEGPPFLPAFGRLLVLGAFLLVGSMSAWLPVIVDYVGFGGFPHRVGGEDGWHAKDLWDAISGHLLDEGRQGIPVLTLLIPVCAIFARATWLPRLWAAAVAYFLILIVGPHLPHGQDDLFPAIRVLGGLQVALALAVGGGFVVLVVEARRLLRGWAHELPGREALGAAAGIIVAATLFGAIFIHDWRVRVASDYPDFHREELDDVFPVIAAQMQGREQVRAGAEAHWSNLLPYVYAGRSAMLQMGGAGLQSSPNYVYQWEQQDVVRSAYIYDAPLVLLKKQQEDQVPGGVVLTATDHYELKAFPASGLVVPVQVVGTLPPGREAERKRGIVWVKGDQPMKNEVLAHDGYGGEGPPPQGIVLAYSRQPSPGDEPDITADVTASAPTTFEVKESWHPRWHAFLDGKPVALRRVTPDFMAIDVPPGQHHLAWRFDRPWWTWAIWLLWPGLTLLGWAISRYLTRAATAGSAAPA